MAKLEEHAKTKSMEDRIAELRARRAELELGGGKDRIEKQHASGKLTARERINTLVDKGTFEEIGIYALHRATLFGMAGKETPADGVVTISSAQMGYLLSGIDWRHPQETWRPSSVG